MKILKKVQLKICVVLTALFLVAASIFGFNVKSSVTADAAEMPANVTYINTDVKSITFAQHPNQVYFGFELTVSDYGDYGKFETDLKEDITATAIYQEYITSWLTHYKNFPEMNSEGSRFTIAYTYWNGSSLGNKFLNALGHRSNLKVLELGYVIYIPAGTTFPSLGYIYNHCKGTPVMYRTTTDVAFFFNGTDFVSMAYSTAIQRQAAVEEVQNVNYDNYHQAEKVQAEALVETYVKKIKLCSSGYQIEDLLKEYKDNLKKIMTVADYFTLGDQRMAAKEALTAYITENFAEEDYDEADWLELMSIKQQGALLIDSVNALGEADVVLNTLKIAADNVLNKAEKPAFHTYVETLIQQLQAAFKAELYREAERAQGEAILQEAAQTLTNAKNYNEVDGLSVNYLVKLNALKTAAELDAEENANNQQPDSSTPDKDSNDNTPAKDSGCGSVANVTSIIFGVAFMAGSMLIKKKADNKDEN